jgi:hypothetical protein
VLNLGIVHFIGLVEPMSAKKPNEPDGQPHPIILLLGLAALAIFVLMRSQDGRIDSRIDSMLGVDVVPAHHSSGSVFAK